MNLVKFVNILKYLVIKFKLKKTGLCILGINLLKELFLIKRSNF